MRNTILKNKTIETQPRKCYSVSGKPKNLDNCNNSAEPTVQTAHEAITANGCHVTMIFAEQSPDHLRENVAEMILTSFLKRKGA